MKWMGGSVSQSMEGFRAKFRVATMVLLALWIGLAGLYGMIKPISNGCTMTYMYPTYIPIPTPANVSSTKYGLHLYHEGWKRIDFNDHLKKLTGVPVLFIPGNGGSYKQASFLFMTSNVSKQYFHHMPVYCLKSIPCLDFWLRSSVVSILISFFCVKFSIWECY